MNPPHTSGVWINAAGATVLRLGPQGLVSREHLDSDVPAHHRGTGRPPTENRPAREGNRDEHLRAFFAAVMAMLPPDDDLLLLGDGEVVEHFDTVLEEREKGRKPGRRIHVERSHPVSENQLIARIREFAGEVPKRGFPD